MQFTMWKTSLFPRWRCLNYGPHGWWYYTPGSTDIVFVRKCDSTEDFIVIPIFFLCFLNFFRGGYFKCQEPKLRRNKSTDAKDAVDGRWKCLRQSRRGKIGLMWPTQLFCCTKTIETIGFKSGDYQQILFYKTRRKSVLPGSIEKS